MAKRSLIKDNARQAAKILLERLQVKFNAISLNWFFFHPQFPSMYAFSQLFDRLKLSHAVIKVAPKDLEELPKPFLTHFVSDGGGFFMVVDGVNENNVQFINETGQVEDYPKSDFLAGWTGVAAIFDPKGGEQETAYLQNRIKEFIAKHRWPFFVTMMCALLFSTILQQGITNYTTLGLILIVTKLIGTLLSGALLIQTFDAQNPFFHKICMPSKKQDCSSILNSKGAKLLGVFSWSEIGFVYFASLLLYLIVFPVLATVFVAAAASLLAVPYTIYSLWYQKYVARIWCKLCLLVQLVLYIDAWLLLFFKDQLVFYSGVDRGIISLFMIGLGLLSAYSVLKPMLEAWIQSKSEMPKLKKLKYDHEVFTMTQKRILPVRIPLEILKPINFGNTSGDHQIIMIANPLCRPCQEAHDSIFSFLEYKQNVSFIEIFAIEDKPENEAYQLALMMLQLQVLLSKNEFLVALKDYYTNYRLSPELWKAKYSNPGINTEEAVERLNQQISWCKEQKITTTPLILYNGSVLSSLYSLTDLDYFTD
jgi:hypothetical protein